MTGEPEEAKKPIRLHIRKQVGNDLFDAEFNLTPEDLGTLWKGLSAHVDLDSALKAIVSAVPDAMKAFVAAASALEISAETERTKVQRQTPSVGDQILMQSIHQQVQQNQKMVDHLADAVRRTMDIQQPDAATNFDRYVESLVKLKKLDQPNES